MSANRKDWYWCKRCRTWVFSFKWPIGAWCDACELDWLNRDNNRAEAKAAAEYLERDYAKEAM